MHQRCCLEAPMSTQRQIKSESLGELIFNVTRWQVEKQWNCFSLKAAQGRWVDQTKSRLEFRCFPIESILSPGLAPPKTWRVVIFPVAPFVSPESSTSGRIRRPICISLNCRNQNFFVWFLSVWSWQSWRLLLSSYFLKCIKRISLCTSFFII